MQTNNSEYSSQQSSTVDAPFDSSKEDVPLDTPTKEVPSQSTKDTEIKATTRPAEEKENFSSTPKSGQELDTVHIASEDTSSSERTKDVEKLNLTSDKKECNYAKGKWVEDRRWPLYSGFSCKRFLSSPWSCRLTSRTDFDFEMYRWQPEGCQMPDFDGSEFLKRMQHKTIAFVGDSLGRQQFQSLMCMVTGGVEDPQILDVGSEYGLELQPGAKRPDGWVYHFLQTNTTILYYWSASLCKLEPLNPKDRSTSYAMHLDQPATFLQQYLDRFDVLVLNTGHHWNRGKLTANRWIMYAEGKPVTGRSNLKPLLAAKNHTVYSVVKWLDSQLPQHPRLKAFFRTLSPRHFANGDWNTGGSCGNTKALSGGTKVKQDGSDDPDTEAAVKGARRVKLLDITALSKLRDEGHISNFRNPKGGYDCLHWCLPGIPDTWNEILAAQI